MVSISYVLVIQGVLIVLGLWWCNEMFTRWRDDLRVMRSPGLVMRKAAVVTLWLITAVILLMVARVGWVLIERGMAALR